MKIKFFEKNIFDPAAREKPTIGTNDKTKTGLDNIKEDYKTQYKSEPLDTQIRQIKIPIENLPFYTDGEKSVGIFKKIDITSGEPEIISSIEQAARSDRIRVSLPALANIEEIPDNTQYNEVESRENDLFEPILDFGIGNLEKVLGRGFSDRSRYIRSIRSSGTSFLSAYNRLRIALTGGSSSTILSENLYNSNFNASTKEEDLPPEILSKQVTVDIDDNETYTREINVRFRGLKNPIPITEYWKIENLKKIITYSFRDVCLYQNNLIIPVVQTFEYQGTPYEVKQDGSRLGSEINESLSAYGPFEINSGNIIQRSSGRDRRTVIIPQVFKKRSEDDETLVEDIVENVSWRLTRVDGQTVIKSITEDKKKGITNPSINYRILVFTSIYIYFNTNLTFFSNLQEQNKSEILSNMERHLFISPRSLYDMSITYPVTDKMGVGLDFRLTHMSLSTQLSGTATIVPSQGDISYSVPDNQKTAAANFIKQYTRTILNRLSGAIDYELPTVTELLDIENTPNPNTLYPGSENPTLDKNDLGIGAEQNSIYLNGKVISPLTFLYQSLSGLITTERKVGFIKLNSRALNIGQADMLQSGDNPEVSADQRLKDRILPISLPGQNSNYEITDIDFTTQGTGANKITVEKVDGSNFVRDEIKEITIRRPNRDPLVLDISLDTNPSGSPRASFESLAIVNLLKYRFKSDSTNPFKTYLNPPVNVPKIQDWIDDLVPNFETTKNKFRPIPLDFSIAVTSQEDTTQDLIRADLERADWPWVKLSRMFYRDDKIFIFLSRNEAAPVPNKGYFDSISIAGRRFDFSDADYTPYQSADDSDNEYGEKGAEFSWNYGSDFLKDIKQVPLTLKKSGTSNTRAVNSSNLVRKSTVKTVENKKFPPFLGGLRVIDFDFDSTKLEITFEGNISSSRFQALSVKSPDGGIITRELRPVDTDPNFTRTVVGNNTTFKWENLPDFKNLKDNKEYAFEMIQGANNSENRFFIPRPGASGFHFVEDLKIKDNELDFSLKKFGSEDISTPFISVAIQNTDGTGFIAFQDIRNGSGKIEAGQADYSFSIPAPGFVNPAADAKYNMVFSVEDLPSFELSILKLTDIYFDTIVILNTNLDDVFITDQLDQDLIHPSDIDIFKSETEGGLRHIVLFLKQPVTSKNINLINRRLFGSSKSREIGQILLLKKIGVFSQFAGVAPQVSQSKKTIETQTGQSHVVSRPRAINYSLKMPPLSKQADWELAQDLFSRAADYNEFLIWVSGGDIVKNRENVNGFKFVDIIKSLVINEENITFQDDRTSSGVTFEMNIVEVQ